MKRAIYKVIACLMLLCGCEDSAQKPQQHNNEKKVLVVGTTADYPPFEFIKDKQIQGLDIDVANAIAKKLGYTIQIKDMDFDGLIPALQTGTVDFAISAMTSTPARASNVSFSTEYYTPSYAMVYRADNSITEPSAMSGNVIAVQLGTTMELYLKSQFKLGMQFKIVSLSNTYRMISELSVGRVSGVLVEESQAKTLVQKYPDLGYSVFASIGHGYAIAFPKNSKLLKEFDDVLLGMRNSGELDIIKQRWLSK